MTAENYGTFVELLDKNGIGTTAEFRQTVIPEQGNDKKILARQ